MLKCWCLKISHPLNIKCSIKIRISILVEEALIVGTENDINDIYSIHDHVALRCLHDMLSLCPHSDDTFTFFRPRSILIMKKMILEVVASNKIGELRNQLKFYRNDNSKPIFFFLYLARTTFLSIAKCHGECLSHNQHLCQHFNRGQDIKSQWHNRILQDCLVDSCLKCKALHEIQSFPVIITKRDTLSHLWHPGITVDLIIKYFEQKITQYLHLCHKIHDRGLVHCHCVRVMLCGRVVTND